MKPCGHDPPIETCRICYLWQHDARYRRLWSGRPPHTSSPARCRHLGPDVVGHRQCSTCRGNVRLKEFVCAVGRGVAGRAVPTMDCGPDRCAGYEAESVDEDDWVRHICYHVYPVANGVWREAVGELLEHLPLFNGRRLAAVMTADGRAVLDPPEAVEEILRPRGFEVLRLANDPSGEAISWLPLVSQLRRYKDGPRQCLFWAHAKGVTKPDSRACRTWRHVLTETSLTDWPLVRDQLQKYPCTGSLFVPGFGMMPPRRRRRRRRSGVLLPPELPGWFYAGTFFWMRLGALFAEPRWPKPSQTYSGVEFHLADLFAVKWAGRLFQPPVTDFYDDAYWDTVIVPYLESWRRQRELRRRGLPIGELAPRSLTPCVLHLPLGTLQP